jgi:hypothetical protein
MTLTACADSPAEPLAAKPSAAAAPLRSASSSAGARLDFSDQVNDLVTRVLPSFADEEAAEALRTHLSAIAAYAAAADLIAAKAASDSARAQLKDGVGSTVDLGAVSATLDVIDRDIATAH